MRCAGGRSVGALSRGVEFSIDHRRRDSIVSVGMNWSGGSTKKVENINGEMDIPLDLSHSNKANLKLVKAWLKELCWSYIQFREKSRIQANVRERHVHVFLGD